MQEHLSALRMRFADLTLREHSDHGDVYAGTDFTGAAVTVAVLSEEAASDPRLAGAFGEAAQRLTATDPTALHSLDLTGGRPWVAVRSDSGADADQLLAPLADVEEAPAADDAPANDEALAADEPAPTGSADAERDDVEPVVVGPTAAESPGEPVDHATGSPDTRVDRATRTPSRARGRGARTRKRKKPRKWDTAAVTRFLTAAGSMVAVPVAATALVFIFRFAENDATPPVPEATKPAPTATAGATAEDRPATGPLRDVPPVDLFGPVWQDDEITFTVDFFNSPFAFRIPITWRCDAGSYPFIPNAPAWRCVDTDPAGEGQRVNVLLWPCPTVCTEEERDLMIRTWLDEPERAVTTDDGLTVYVETLSDERGYHTVDLSRFAADPRDPEVLRWHVGVYAEAPADNADAPLKVLNDILTQLQ